MGEFGQFIPFFNSDAGLTDECCERATQHQLKELKVLGIHPKSGLPFLYSYDIVEERNPDTSAAAVYGIPLVSEYHSPKILKNPHPLCPEVQYSAIQLLTFLSTFNVMACRNNESAVTTGEHNSLLYIPANIRMRDMAQSFMKLLTHLQTRCAQQSISTKATTSKELDTLIDSYAGLALTLDTLINDKEDQYMPVFYKGNLLENIKRVQHIYSNQPKPIQYAYTLYIHNNVPALP